MKIRKKTLYTGVNRAKSDSPDSSGEGDWAITDPSEMRQAAETQKAMSATNRPPELWIKDAEARVVRFLADEPIASFNEYSVKMDGKFRSFVCPPEGAPDLFSTRLGARARRVFIYPVIDLTGYVDKQGKKHKDEFRFYKVGTRLYDQLIAYAEESGCGLSDMTLKVRRTGKGTSTAYALFTVNTDPLTSAQRAVKILNWKQYYKPLTLTEQKAIIGKLSVSED